MADDDDDDRIGEGGENCAGKKVAFPIFVVPTSPLGIAGCPAEAGRNRTKRILESSGPPPAVPGAVWRRINYDKVI